MRLRGKLGILALATVSSTALAQLPLNPSIGTQIASLNQIGGTAAIDVIPLRQGMLGAPLRYGGVLAGSEHVELNGKSLRRGADYQIDLNSGVVYLMSAIKAGDVLRCGYRYDSAKVEQQRAGSQFAGMAPFKLDIAPGALGLVMGFGMTERQAGGAVVQTNIYGVNNRLSMGSTQLKGLSLMGNSEKVNQTSDYEYRDGAQAKDTGASHFTLQNLTMALGGGGSIEVNVQDISKNFSGFNAVQDAGYSADQVRQLQKERGLKRFSLGMTGAQIGGLKFSGGMRTVNDDGEEVGWKNLGLAGSGFELNWKSQKVGDAFKRFNDLSESDREQLKKEVGMERETLSGAFGSKTSKLSFAVNHITDPQSASIERRDVNFDSAKFKLNYGSQEVDQSFQRMQSLKGDEQQLWGRELGMKRQWFGLQASLFGAGEPIKFSQNILSSKDGEYNATDLRFAGKGWSLEQIGRDASAGFSSFNAMQDGERNENINAIGRMYDPAGVPFRGEEVSWFNRSTGISRQLTRFQAQPFKDWKLNFDHLALNGKTDGATVDTFSAQNKRYKIDFRHQDLGDQFGELASLLNLERNRLGTISGLERTDFNVAVALSPSRNFLYSNMNAKSPNGAANRESVSYADPRLAISMTQREVDPGFTNVNQLVDPEKDFLAAMRGFKERDVKASWQINPNLKFDMFLLDSGSESLDQVRYIHNYELNWKPDKLTSVLARRFEAKNDDPLSALFASATNLLKINHDFGRFGKLSYLEESRDYDGLQSQTPDWRTRYYAYETQLNPKTSLKAEQRSTDFGNGDKEDVSTQTVSTELSKHVGVSVSDMKIDRGGDTRDEKKRGYGFWCDLGNGIRLAYGFAQHRAGETALDTRNQNVSLTGGAVGNVQVGNGNYTENQWEGDRTQSMGAFSLATIKPMSFLGLTDLKINASLDTAADRQIWMKENQLFGISGKAGQAAIGFEYRSQIAPNGFRGIDRSAYLTSDQSEKKALRVSFKYKQRNLPSGEEILIRDYSIVGKLAPRFELSHNLLTHPEVARGDVILGSVTQARQENRWKLDYTANKNLQLGGEWREFIDQGQPLTRLGGLNLTLNKATGSPVSLFYGVEESDATGTRKRNDRYHIRFDQRPGAHQTFSFFVGNVSYLRGIDRQQKRNNLTLQLNYQIKF